MKNKRHTSSSLNYLLLLLFVPIDAVSGIMANYSNGMTNVIGYLYRAIIIIYNGKTIINKSYCEYFIALGILLLGVLLNDVVRINSNFRYDILLFIRLLYFVTICLGVSWDIKKNKLRYDQIKDIMNKSTYLIITVYFASFAVGKGLISYSENGSGYKAFFNSVNSLTCVLIILSGFQLFQLFEDNRRKHLVLYGVLSLFLILLGSKSGIAFWGMYLVYTLLCNRIHTVRHFRVLLLTVAAIPLGAVVLTLKFAEQIKAIIGRFTYFMGTSDSWIQFILSGRSDLLICGWKEYWNDFNLLDLFLGKGAYNMQVLIGHASMWGTLKNVEMDFFDIFFSYGLLGIVVTYGLVVAVYKQRKNRSSRALKVLFYICVFFSVLGGHIFQDSFGSTILALVLGLNLCWDSPKKGRRLAK